MTDKESDADFVERLWTDVRNAMPFRAADTERLFSIARRAVTAEAERDAAKSALNGVMSLIGQMSTDEWVQAHRTLRTPGFECMSDEEARKWFDHVSSEGWSALAERGTREDFDEVSKGQLVVTEKALRAAWKAAGVATIQGTIDMRAALEAAVKVMNK